MGAMSSTEENNVWDNMLKKYGSIVMATKISKLESSRKYYKAYPLDHCEYTLPIEYAEDVPIDDNPFDYVVGNEAIAAMLVNLTAKERIVVDLSAQGYKPKEIAELKGQASINWRWHKNAAKKKMLA